MTKPQGAVQALRLRMPGASQNWHTVGDIGLFHPDIAVPLDTLGITEARAKELSKDDGCPLALEPISEADAKTADAAYAEAATAAAVGTAEAARNVATVEERNRISDAITAIKPNPPEEG